MEYQLPQYTTSIIVIVLVVLFATFGRRYLENLAIRNIRRTIRERTPKDGVIKAWISDETAGWITQADVRCISWTLTQEISLDAQKRPRTRFVFRAGYLMGVDTEFYHEARMDTQEFNQRAIEEHVKQLRVDGKLEARHHI